MTSQTATSNLVLPTIGGAGTTGKSTRTSPMVYARIAGLLYLIVAVAAAIAHFYVPSQLLVPGDAAATASNIMASESLYRIGAIGGELVVLLIEVVLSVLLYFLLRPVSRMLSLAAAVARLAMTIIHGINLINYFFVLLLLSGADYLSVFPTEQLHALALLFLDAHSYGFTIGIAFFSLHVFLLGYLVLRSGFFPRLMGAMFLVASIGYLIDSSALLLSTSYDTTPAYVAIPIAIAEIAFPLWLLIKGVNVRLWEQRALESA